MKTVLYWLLFLGLYALSHVAFADVYWLDSRGSASYSHYRTAEEACAIGEAQRRLDGYRSSISLPLRYRPVYVGPDDGFNERPCRTVIEKKMSFVGWVTVEAVDTLVYGPNGSQDPCNISGLRDPDTGQCGSPKRPTCCGGMLSNGSDPIHSASGNKYQVETDFVGGGPWPLRFTRTYNSYFTVNNRPTPFGPGWTHTYQRSIVDIASVNGGSAEVVYAYRPDGGILTFTRNGSAWVGDPDVSEKLSGTTENGVPNGWTLTTTEDTVESYDQTGRLTSIKQRGGLSQKLAYSGARLASVKGPEGRALSFAYDSNGRMSSITLPDGSTVSYAYDSAGNLESATYPSAASGTVTRTYLYNETGQTGGVSQPHAMTGLVDENQQRFASWGYGADHRADLSVQGNYATGTTGRTEITYNANGTNTITDALGQERAVAFSLKYGVPHLSDLDTACDYCGAIGASATYDSNGYPSLTTDFRGTQTQHSYNVRGLETERVEAVGTSEQRTRQTDWHATYRVPLERRSYDASASLIATQGWVYNSRGQMLVHCEIDPAKAPSYACAASGTPPDGVRRWVYTYCNVTGGQCPIVGLLLTVDGPRTDVSDITHYSYYSSTDESGCGTAGGVCHRAGDIYQVVDALGHITTHASYDKNGRIRRMIDTNSVVIDYLYDLRGRLTSRIVRALANGSPSANDAVTTFEYDDAGNLLALTDPDGVYLTYTYDNAHRLTDVTDALGNTVHFTLNAMGKRVQEDTYDPSHLLRHTVSRVYDMLGRLRQQLDAQNRAILFEYDGNGNKTDTTDRLGVVTHKQYDALDRLIETLQDYQGTDSSTQNASSSFGYDSLDQLTGIMDPDGLQTIYVRDALGSKTSSTSPDSGVTLFAYDAAGNVTSRTDARGVTSTYTYDALNRITSSSFPTSAASANYYFDENDSVTGCSGSYAIGRLTRVVESNVTTTYCYDMRGNITSKSQQQGTQTDTVAYQYTLGDRLSAITYPSGTDVSYVHDATGRIQQVDLTIPGIGMVTAVSSITYMPFGPIGSYTLGNGQVISRSYDENYALTDIVSPALSLHFALDAMGHISALGNSPGASPAYETYGYDALYRLKDVRDGSGNLVESYTYTQAGDRLSKTATGLATGTYTYTSGSHHLSTIGTDARSYDANGNTSSSAIAGENFGFTYDDRNRLVEVTRNGATAGVYSYNAFGARIAKTASVPQNLSERYAYDQTQRLIAEYGDTNRDYIWVDDLPVAIVDLQVGTGSVHYIHADGLGTPRVVADDAGTTVWQWDFQGNPFGEQSPTSSTGYLLNMRYPGQQYDAESLLSYNVNRNYEAATGRYSQSDPLGLRGGINPYRYSFNNALSYFDPLGLQACERIVEIMGLQQKKLINSTELSTQWELKSASVIANSQGGLSLLGKANPITAVASAALSKPIVQCFAVLVKTFGDTYQNFRNVYYVSLCFDEAPCGQVNTRLETGVETVPGESWTETRKQDVASEQKNLKSWFAEAACQVWTQGLR